MFALKRLLSSSHNTFTRQRWASRAFCATLFIALQACGGDVTIGDNRSGAESVPSSSGVMPGSASEVEEDLRGDVDNQGGADDEGDPNDNGDADNDEAFGDCVGRFGDFEEFPDGGVPDPCGDRGPDDFMGEPDGPMNGFDSDEFFGPPSEDVLESFDGGVWEENDL